MEGGHRTQLAPGVRDMKKKKKYALLVPTQKKNMVHAAHFDAINPKVKNSN